MYNSGLGLRVLLLSVVRKKPGFFSRSALTFLSVTNVFSPRSNSRLKVKVPGVKVRNGLYVVYGTFASGLHKTAGFGTGLLEKRF